MSEVEAASSLFDLSGQEGDFFTGISSPTTGESSEQSHEGTPRPQFSESQDIHQQFVSGSSAQDDFFNQVGAVQDEAVPAVGTQENHSWEPSYSYDAENATETAEAYGADYYNTQTTENSEGYYSQGTTDTYSQWEQYNTSQYSSYGTTPY